MSLFNDKVAKLLAGHEALLMRKNEPVEEETGDYALPLPCTDCSAYSCLLAIRPERGDESFLMERIGMNATLNAGAIKWDGKYLMLVRVEGADRKSFLLLPKARTVLIISASGSIR